ncbi:ESX secretion-associated protein EspG [Nocardia camponoti]|uniref:ESX secretion-associated protein EspG n=1 Tax=Nocardia camponoti TaxID=1616106 RepID=A0A917V5P3_9NOCA|nr:ESX secretion-associated protein EspG [Nocardia camponoti]GGK40332.1 hypothetical protein GCM10011591_09970 [Nocardia camponoti]
MPAYAQWRFTALEFRTLWESTGRDVLPYPLHHEWSVELQSDANRLRAEAASVVVPQLNDDLAHAVHLLLNPQVRVEVAGFVGRERTVRAHGAIGDGYASLASQSANGTVELTLLAAADLPAATLSLLPSRAPGTAPQIQLPATELDAPRPYVRDTWNPTPREQFDAFLASRKDADYHIAVYPHGSMDNRHVEGRDDFQLTDRPDGRYVLYGTRTLIIKPADPARVRATLATIVNEMLAKVLDGTYLPH